MSHGHLVMFGCGRMGGALLSQWLATGAWKGHVSIVKPSPELPEGVEGHALVRTVPSVDQIGIAPALVVLAVKPQMLDEVLPACRAFGNAVPYFTIAAGRRLDSYYVHLPRPLRIVRAMPNTPSLIGMGMCALHAGEDCEEADRQLAEGLMRAVGEIAWLEDETLMDAATAISGSGPAYVFYFMECLISAAIEAGLDERTARLMVVQTLNGSSELAYLSGESLSKLRLDVTSPGGTTEAALSRLMHPSGMLRLMQDAVASAVDRARELSVSAKQL